MTDAEIRDYLRDNGYPSHIVRGGREGLVRRWRQFVTEVEQGYEFGLEDYRNDLDVRLDEVRFACLSPTSGRYELLLDRSFDPRTSGTVTANGQSADARTVCDLKSYSTHAP